MPVATWTAGSEVHACKYLVPIGMGKGAPAILCRHYTSATGTAAILSLPIPKEGRPRKPRTRRRITRHPSKGYACVAPRVPKMKTNRKTKSLRAVNHSPDTIQEKNQNTRSPRAPSKPNRKTKAPSSRQPSTRHPSKNEPENKEPSNTIEPRQQLATLPSSRTLQTTTPTTLQPHIQIDR